MNNVIKTDLHTFNTSLPFKPLKYFYNCETAASNGFASMSAAGSGGASAPKPVLLKFYISHFLFCSFFKSSSVSPVWIRASRHRHSFRRERAASAGLRCQAMTPASLIAPPPLTKPAKLECSSRLSGRGRQANACSIKTWWLWGISSLFVCLNA